MVGIAKIQFDEVDASVFQIIPARRGSHSSPDLHALLECMLYDETANETAGSGNQYFHDVLQFECKGKKIMLIITQKFYN